MLTCGNDKVRTAAKRGIVAFIIVILAAANLHYAPFWTILGLSYLMNMG